MPEPLNLLIVEDSRDDAELLLQALRQDGFAVAYNIVDSEAAMRAALAREWDAIASDHSMPGFNAVQALSLARRLQPHTAFIVVSGETDVALAVSLIKQGAHDFVQKRELSRAAAAIRGAMAEARMRRAHERDARSLEAAEARYRGLFEAAPNAVAIINADSGQIVDANESFTKMTGCMRDELIGRSFGCVGAFAHGVGTAALKEMQEQGSVRYARFGLRTSNGSLREVEFVGGSFVAGNSRLLQANLLDHPARRRSSAHDEAHPDYDGLTGLPNRALFHDRLGYALKLAERERQELSLLCLELEQLRSRYGPLGDGAIDQVLVRAAETIRALVRQSDTVARIGDDQFAVILPKTAAPRGAVAVAKKIKDALTAHLRPAGKPEDHVRIGYSAFPNEAENAEKLLQAAGTAMHGDWLRDGNLRFDTP